MTRTIPLEDPVAEAYIAWSRDERHPPNTIRRRCTVLRSIGNPGTATREEIEAWWATRRHLKASGRANDLAVLRGFIHWCQVWEYRKDDPTVRIKTPKTGAGAPKPFTRRELAAILEQVQHDPRLRRAVLLGAAAGLRVSEAANLSWDDIDPETRRARVTGKGNKTRVVKLSAKLLTELGTAATGRNVVTGTAQAWAPDTLGRKVNRAIRAAGVVGTFHKLRHRYGSLGYQLTKDPKALAEQMGHASVATTMAFYAASADDAADAIADAVSEGW